MKSIRISKLIGLVIVFLFAVPMICNTGCAGICGQADIVFVFDTTGSMSGSINSMKSNAVSFANALAASGIDYKLGLTEVRDFPNICGGNCGSPGDSAYKLYDNGNLADSARFNSWISSLSAGGGADTPEAYLAALHHAALYTRWRGGSVQKIIVLISDAPPHADGDCCNFEGDTFAGTKNALNAMGVTVFVAGYDWGGAGVPYGWATNLATSTGGKYYPLGDLTPILNDIKDKLKCKEVILLVHGIFLPDAYDTQRDPYITLEPMARYLTGSDVHIDLPDLYMERFEGNNRVVYICQWARDTDCYYNPFPIKKCGLMPTLGDIKVYAGNLVLPIAWIQKREKVQKIDIIAHSMGGLISRWYIEKFDKSDSVDKLIMIGTPNRGTEQCNPESDLTDYYWLRNYKGHYTDIDQMRPDSDFVKNDLGYDGRSNYYIIAGTATHFFSNAALSYFGGYLDQWYKNNHDGMVGYPRTELNLASSPTSFSLDHLNIVTNQQVFQKIDSILTSESTSAKSENTTIDLDQPLLTGTLQRILPRVVYKIYPNEERTQDININFARQAKIILLGQYGNLSLNLTTPDGELITKSNTPSNITYNEFDSASKAYSIDYPETGQWKAYINAINVTSNGSNYMIIAYIDTNLTLGVYPTKYQWKPNEQIEIKANLSNSSLPVIGTNVIAQFIKPDMLAENISLFDDGLHNDSLANDGIYANVFENSSISGAYLILVSANGKLDDQEFQRYQSTKVWVQLYSDLTLSPSDISFSNSSPLPDQTVTLTTTIHNIGEASAKNASIFFYDGSPGTGNLIATSTADVNAGETANVNAIWSALPGTHSINVWVSPFNAFLESNYSNNNASKLISVDNPPVAPTPPSGPTSGVPGTSYSYSTSAVDLDGDQVKFNFDWGDGTKNVTSLVSSGASVSASHKWSKAGTFLVRANATDSRGASSEWSTSLPVTIITPPNTPPNAPSIPSGSKSGYAYVPYSFSTSAIDPNGDQVKYTFDWGDSTPRSTTGLVSSGTAASAIHTWTSAGAYQVKAMTTDGKDATSGWSGSLAVTIAANKPPNAPTKLTGPTSGTVGTNYPYVTVATDPNGDQVKYTYDWGDKTTFTTPLVKSGTTASISHRWSAAGTYLVRTMTTDSKGAPSSWSSVLTVKIVNKLQSSHTEQTTNRAARPPRAERPARPNRN